MEALYENVDVTYVGINVEGSTDSIHRFELFRAHEEEPFAFATRGGSAIGDDFGARLVNQEFVCAESTYPDIIVRARTRTDMEGGVSGQDVTVALGGIEARGFTSNNVLSQNDGDGTIDEGEILIGLPYSEIGSNQQIIGQPNVTVMSKIVDIQNASVDAHGSAIPIGNSPICEFKFTAADHINFKHGSNDVVLDGIIYTVSATNVLLATDGLALYNKSDQTTVVDTYTLYATDGTEITGDTATGTILVMFDGLHDSVVNTEIDRGDSETFVLEANIINTSIDPRFGSALQVGLQRFNQIDSVFGVTGDANDSHISWLDYDAQPVTPRFDWIEHRETVIKGTSYNDGVPTASELPLAESYPPEPFTWSAETAKKKREAAADHFFEMMI